MMKLDKKKCMNILSLFKCENIVCFCEKWSSFMKDCNLYTKASHFGVTSNDIDFIVNKVNLERLKGHPIKLEKTELREIVRNII